MLIFKKQAWVVCFVWITVLSLFSSLGYTQNTDSLDKEFSLLDSTFLQVKKSKDFQITGDGSSKEWEVANWVLLNKINGDGYNYQGKFKIMYSEQGIYLLFNGEDNKLTTKDYEDMDHLWFGDVFEAFFYPDPKKSTYFEFQVNPLGKQLLLTISKSNNGMSWTPFNRSNRDYYGTFSKAKITKGTAAKRKTKLLWQTEVFISYKSLGLLPKTPPRSGDVWKANFYRLDYDTGQIGKWSWSPTIEESFHELNHFGSIQFE